MVHGIMVHGIIGYLVSVAQQIKTQENGDGEAKVEPGQERKSKGYLT